MRTSPISMSKSYFTFSFSQPCLHFRASFDAESSSTARSNDGEAPDKRFEAVHSLRVRADGGSCALAWTVRFIENTTIAATSWAEPDARATRPRLQHASRRRFVLRADAASSQSCSPVYVL